MLFDTDLSALISSFISVIAIVSNGSGLVVRPAPVHEELDLLHVFISLVVADSYEGQFGDLLSLGEADELDVQLEPRTKAAGDSNSRVPAMRRS